MNAEEDPEPQLIKPSPPDLHKRRRPGCRRFAGAEYEVNPLRAAFGVGERLRALRCQRGYSIRSLAELSGLNPNTISLIENGHSSPSVATLAQIAAPLGVPLAAFFEREAPQQSIVYFPPQACPEHAIAQGMLGELGAGFSAAHLEPFLVSLQPGAESDPTPVLHTGVEFIYCLAGRLDYTILGQEYVLEPGASLLFEARLPHAWKNPGPDAASLLLLLCASDPREPVLERHFNFLDPLTTTKDQSPMKLAISANKPEFQTEMEPRFGRCACFILVDPQTGDWESSPNPALEAADGAGVLAAQHLADRQVTAVISGHFGPKAAAALQAAGIKMINAIPEQVAGLVEKYRHGQLA